MRTAAIFTSAALLATSAVAAPAASETKYYWSVSDFTGGASPATSAYSFNITGKHHSPNIPPFKTTCHWAQINGDTYQPCEPAGKNKAVAVKMTYIDADVTTYNVAVQYSFVSGSPLYIYDGNTTVGSSDPSQPQAFTIVPSSAQEIS